jgi:hypothetical protein
MDGMQAQCRVNSATCLGVTVGRWDSHHIFMYRNLLLIRSFEYLSTASAHALETRRTIAAVLLNSLFDICTCTYVDNLAAMLSVCADARAVGAR